MFDSLALSTNVLPSFSTDEYLAAILSFPFKSFELNSRLSDATSQVRPVTTLMSAGLTCRTIGLLLYPDDIIQEEFPVEVIAALEALEIAKCRTVTLYVIPSDRSKLLTESIFRSFLYRLRSVDSLAGINIYVENVASPNGPPFLNNPLLLFECLKDTSFRITFDPANSMLCGHAVDTLQDEFFRCVKHVHIKNFVKKETRTHQLRQWVSSANDEVVSCDLQSGLYPVLDALLRLQALRMPVSATIEALETIEDLEKTMSVLGNYHLFGLSPVPA